MRKIIGPDIKVLSGPLFVIILTSALAVIGFNISYEAITGRIESYKTAKNAERALIAKHDILKGVERGSLERANRLAQILPETHPGSTAINQVKKITQDGLIVLTNIELKNENQLSDNITSADFLFEATSEGVVDIVNVLQNLGKTAPLNNLKKVEISLNTENVNEARIESNIFWSGYPDSISSVSTPVLDFTSEEQNQLAELGNYRLPDFSVLTPSTPEERENPFN